MLKFTCTKCGRFFYTTLRETKEMRCSACGNTNFRIKNEVVVDKSAFTSKNTK